MAQGRRGSQEGPGTLPFMHWLSYVRTSQNQWLKQWHPTWEVGLLLLPTPSLAVDKTWPKVCLTQLSWNSGERSFLKAIFTLSPLRKGCPCSTSKSCVICHHLWSLFILVSYLSLVPKLSALWTSADLNLDVLGSWVQGWRIFFFPVMGHHFTESLLWAKRKYDQKEMRQPRKLWTLVSDADITQLPTPLIESFAQHALIGLYF